MHLEDAIATEYGATQRPAATAMIFVGMAAVAATFARGGPTKQPVIVQPLRRPLRSRRSHQNF